MKSPLARIRQGAFTLAIVFLVAVAGYRFIGGYSWTEAVWMVVVTVTGVGFSERSQLSPTLQLFTVGVIILGMSALAYTFGGFLQSFLAGEMERHWGHQRMTKEINQLTEHTILCGLVSKERVVNSVAAVVIAQRSRTNFPSTNSR